MQYRSNVKWSKKYAILSWISALTPSSHSPGFVVCNPTSNHNFKHSACFSMCFAGPNSFVWTESTKQSYENITYYKTYFSWNSHLYYFLILGPNASYCDHRNTSHESTHPNFKLFPSPEHFSHIPSQLLIHSVHMNDKTSLARSVFSWLT